MERIQIIKEILLFITIFILCLIFIIVFTSNLIGFFFGVEMKCSDLEKRIITDNYITGASWKLVCIKE